MKNKYTSNLTTIARRPSTENISREQAATRLQYTVARPKGVSEQRWNAVILQVVKNGVNQ